MLEVRRRYKVLFTINSIYFFPLVSRDSPRLLPGTEACRHCFFNTRLYGDSFPDQDLPEYPDCPCCVLAIYEKDVAENEAGLRCEFGCVSLWHRDPGYKCAEMKF